jgi:hypothetical protein
MEDRRGRRSLVDVLSASEEDRTGRGPPETRFKSP